MPALRPAREGGLLPALLGVPVVGVLAADLPLVGAGLTLLLRWRADPAVPRYGARLAVVALPGWRTGVSAIASTAMFAPLRPGPEAPAEEPTEVEAASPVGV